MPEQVKVEITPSLHPDGETTVWSATVNGATFPLVTYGMELVDGRPMVSLVVDAGNVQVGPAVPPPAQPEAKPKTSTWGDPTIPDPREQIPGWSRPVSKNVAANAEVSA